MLMQIHVDSRQIRKKKISKATQKSSSDVDTCFCGETRKAPNVTEIILRGFFSSDFILMCHFHHFWLHSFDEKVKEGNLFVSIRTHTSGSNYDFFFDFNELRRRNIRKRFAKGNRGEIDIYFMRLFDSFSHHFHTLKNAPHIRLLENDIFVSLKEENWSFGPNWCFISVDEENDVEAWPAGKANSISIIIFLGFFRFDGR